MTKEQQRIAIAEACGWKEEDFGPSWYQSCTKMPDYLNDLNAMHEAEKVLDYNQLREMEDSVSFQFAVYPFHATATQRAEAFLRTINKWEETKI
jgi:hypothetical protein